MLIWCIPTLLLPVAGQMISPWTLKLSRSFDILGPFPIHAREQHFLEPSFPIDVTSPINFTATYPSSYADGGQVSWRKAQIDSNSDILEVSFPDVRWKALRDTEGWAALQHHAVLKTSFTVYPGTPSDTEFKSSSPPNIHVQLTGGSYFTIISSSELESESSKEIPRWYSGNIYDIEPALPHIIQLPELSRDKPTIYDIFISGDYEIRLFGDPRVQHNSETPVQIIRLDVTFDDEGIDKKDVNVVREPTHDVIPDVVSGWTFGDAIGVGLRARDGWWSVSQVKLPATLEEYLSLDLPSTNFRLAPTQTRILPLRISQHRYIPPSFSSITFTLILSREQPDVHLRRHDLTPDDAATLEVSLSITHTHLVESDSNLDPTYIYIKNPVVKGSYFFGASHSMPTNFLVVPPRLEGNGRTPVLALHGAGVDIFSPTPVKSFWAQALPRQDRSWVVIPSGRTSWGLDWHGPSAQDAWGALDATTHIVHNSKSTIWGGGKWGIPVVAGKAQAIVMGHSNGGQGTWHIAARSPDRVVGIIPAAAYVKSQSYVPWTMSRSAHYADPFLEAILQTSLTPDDNDLFLGNLHGKNVLAIHGGADENVPVWHSRELFSVLQSLRGSGSNTSRLEYQEILDQPHWFPSVLNSDYVQSFIDELLDKVDQEHANDASVKLESFKLTVALPAEMGSMRGFRVEKLSVPGRLGRISVDVTLKQISLSPRVVIGTTNILAFSIDPKIFDVLAQNVELWVDGNKMHLNSRKLEDEVISFKAIESRIWKLSSAPNRLQLSGRMQTILSSPERPIPLIFVIPDPAIDSESKPSRTTSHAMSVALRLAHDLSLYHGLDSEIVFNSEVNFIGSDSALSKGNIVVVGNQAALALRSTLYGDEITDDQAIFSDRHTFFISLDEFLEKVRTPPRKKDFGPDVPELQPGQGKCSNDCAIGISNYFCGAGVVFLHPHPLNSHAKMLLLQSTDALGIGLERAARLFPIRTRIPVPDWIIVGEAHERGEGDVVSAGLWDSDWNWSKGMSWSSAS